MRYRHQEPNGKTGYIIIVSAMNDETVFGTRVTKLLGALADDKITEQQ